MKPVCLATTIVLMICSGVLAGARIDLRPDPPMPIGGYAANTVIDVELVMVDTGSPQEHIDFEHISFDLTDTTGDLTFTEYEDAICCGCPAYMQWTSGPCSADCFICPEFIRPSWLALNTEYSLPHNGELELGRFTINIGAHGGLLDVVNADDPIAFHGAFAHLTIHNDGDPEMWSAYAGDFTGGQLEIGVSNGVQSGSIIAWGENFYGQLNIPAPNYGFVAVSAGGAHSLGLKSDGSIVTWGFGYPGYTNVVPPPNSGFVAVAAGYGHSLGLKSDGSIVAWGRNNYGQTDVPAPNSGFVAVAAGAEHSLGLRSDGSIVAWGKNDYGQTDVPTPNSGFVAVAAGLLHSLGLKSDGSIVGWGWSIYGQTNVPAPNSGFVSLSAGGKHSLGVKSDGSVVAWGDNSHLQRNVPAPNTGFVAVAAGLHHSLGLKSDGSIVGWGAYGQGQLNVPAPNSGYVSVSAGQYHSLAIRAEASATIHIIGSEPANGSIDGRQQCPDICQDGWSSIQLTFNGDTALVSPSDFFVSAPWDLGPAPQVVNVHATNSDTVDLTLSSPIEDGLWTVLLHSPSGTWTRIGWLPGDVSGDGRSSPVDILALIDALNGVITLPAYSTDIDRSGQTNPADILREIDLLNGADFFDVWNGAHLP